MPYKFWIRPGARPGALAALRGSARRLAVLDPRRSSCNYKRGPAKAPLAKASGRLYARRTPSLLAVGPSPRRRLTCDRRRAPGLSRVVLDRLCRSAYLTGRPRTQTHGLYFCSGPCSPGCLKFTYCKIHPRLPHAAHVFVLARKPRLFDNLPFCHCVLPRDLSFQAC